MDYFRRFFGLGSHGHNNGMYDDEWNRQFHERPPQPPNGSFFHSNSDEDEGNVFSFNVFTDPLQMHSYFEHKMNELMRQFGMGDNFLFSKHFPELPAIEDGSEQPQQFRSLRDQYLKPGYHTTDESDKNYKVDGDLDGQVSSADLDSLFKDKNTQTVVPVQPQRPQPRTQFFGQSVTSRIIQKPDGTIETHKTIRNHDGSEETTVTRKKNDQEYTITTKRDKDGREEKTENLVNIDEKDISSFLKDNQTNVPAIPTKPPNWFDFDKFFK